MGLAATEAHVGQQGKCSRCGAVFEIAPPPTSSPYQPPGLSPVALSQAAGGPYPTVKPGKVQAISIMMLIGGILATINGVGWLIAGVASMGVLCLWPGGYYSLVMGIMAIVSASKQLGQEAHVQPPPKTIAIMQIINIVNCDIPNCVMGILALVFLNEPEVRGFYRG